MFPQVILLVTWIILSNGQSGCSVDVLFDASDLDQEIYMKSSESVR